MDIVEVNQILGHHERLISLARDARTRGQTEFADVLENRALNFLDQIVVGLDRELALRKRQRLKSTMVAPKNRDDVKSSTSGYQSRQTSEGGYVPPSPQDRPT